MNLKAKFSPKPWFCSYHSRGSIIQSLILAISSHSPYPLHILASSFITFGTQDRHSREMFCVKSYSMVGMMACTNFRNTMRYMCTPSSPPPSVI